MAEPLIGEVLIAIGAIDQKQLNEALNEQDDELHDQKIGQFLIDLGYLHRQQLEMALGIQRREREGEDDPNPYLTTRAHIDMTEILQHRSPDMVIGIEEVYGNYSVLPGSLDGVILFRQEGEANEALAERAMQELKPKLLELLADEDARKRFENSQKNLTQDDIDDLAAIDTANSRGDSYTPVEELIEILDECQPTTGDDETLTEKHLGIQSDEKQQ